VSSAAPIVLVTGATGCIGSVTVRDLLARGAARVFAASRSGEAGTLGTWLDVTRERGLSLCRLDIEQADSIEPFIQRLRPTQIVHLAALQSPDCDADPSRGLSINVGGTLHLLRAAERVGTVERFVFASSAAVYGLRDRYRGPEVAESDELAPPNLYGVWKLAGEQLARQFHERSGIPTVSLRLNTTYGPGRDRGRTAAPTRAIEAVAHAMRDGTAARFAMPYGGRENYHFVEDVGASFAEAALAPFTGHDAFNLLGQTVPVAEFLALIRRVAGELGSSAPHDLSIAADATPNPFVCDLADQKIADRFPTLRRTALEEGIRRTLRFYSV
jgi:nucleoside-diphosphate-sugar epimerase